jgi:biofilm PGA synthesis lipoprotein PgaB
MAMPLMEKQSYEESHAWLEKLVATVKSRPGALDRTVFELQARDWTKQEDADIDGGTLAEWMRVLQRQGVTSFGYYPDNFLDNLPELKAVRPSLSNKWNP